MVLPSYYDSKPLPKPSVHRRTRSSFAASSPGTSRNSSLNKVWSEDYYSYDCEWGNQGEQDKDEGLQIKLPEPATLTSRPFPRSIPLTEDEDHYPPRQPRTHQRSLTALLPFRTKSSSRSPERKSPKKEKTQIEFEDEFMPTLTGDRDGVIRIEDKPRGGLSSWFSGSSAPVAIGVPVTEQESCSPSSNMSSRDTSPERAAAKLRKRPTLATMESASTPTKAPASTGGRFNFFSSPKSPPKQQTIQLPTHLMENDEFLTLDINQALFPSSSPAATDPFSPSAFKNLLMNAEGLLLKLQTAYKLQTLSLHELSADHSAQRDELEESKTRSELLKAQLDEMSNKVLDQDKLVEELVMELAREKQARQEEKEAREKSIALIKSQRLSMSSPTSHEDLGITSARRRWRNSGGSSELDESDTDAGSATESVFSRSRSPTLTVNSAISASSTLTNESGEILQASFGRVVSLSSPTNLIAQHQQRPKMVQQPSTFQKVLNSISPSNQEKSPGNEEGGMGLEDGCRNCQGKDASVAWDTVGLLRVENRGLKERVGVLEGCVEGAMDLCAGLGR